MKLSFKGSGLPDHPTIRAAFEAMAGQKVHADTTRYINEAMRLVDRYCAYVQNVDPHAVAAIIESSGMDDFMARRALLAEADSKVRIYSQIFSDYDGESFTTSMATFDKGAADMLLNLQIFYAEKMLPLLDSAETFNHSFVRRFMEVNLDLHKKFSAIAQEPALSDAALDVLNQLQAVLHRRVTEKYNHYKKFAEGLPDDPLIQKALENMLENELTFDIFRERPALSIAAAKLIVEYNLSQDLRVIAAALCTGGLVNGLTAISPELAKIVGDFLEDTRPAGICRSKEIAILVCATRIVRAEKLDLGKNTLELFSLQIQSALEEYPDIGDAAFRACAENTLRLIDDRLSVMINTEAAARKQGGISP